MLIAAALSLGVMAMLMGMTLPRAYLRVIRSLRKALVEDLTYRTPTLEDTALVLRLDEKRVLRDQLKALGFERVGDLVLLLPGDEVHAAIRVFIAADKKTIAYVAAVTTTVVAFESFYDTHEIVTSYTKVDAYIEAGPTSRRQFIPLRVPIAEAYRQHQRFAAHATVTFSTLDEAQAAMRDAHLRLVRWREEQPPAALLEADLRLLLGHKYALYGWWLKKRIPDVPRATAMRV